MPGYFETIGARLRDGRLPTEADYTSGFRGAVINESAARTLFPAGRGWSRRSHGGVNQPWTVLGVIADLRHRGPLDTRSRNYPQVFFPFEPAERDLNRAMVVVMRPSGSGPGLASSVAPGGAVDRSAGAGGDGSARGTTGLATG